jgi:H+/Cl- antiporter ClcA
MKTAKRSVFIITITMMIIYMHMLIFYQIFYTNDSNGNVSSICNPPTGFYVIFSSFLYVIIYGCLPIILMFTFGILTLINIRKQKRIIRPIMTINVRRLQQSIRLNTQLLKMLLVQILVISITTFPFIIFHCIHK